MKIRFSVSGLFFFLAFPAVIFSQTFNKPNVALKSHQTLEILKVDVTAKSTVVSLSIENKRSEGGSFCADKKIYILYPDGTRLNLTKSKNIPVCPQTYNFKSIGEKLLFTLEFPPLKAGTKWVDIIEDCSSNCFWFYGVTLDNDLNKRLDDAFLAAENAKPAENIILFNKILNDIESQNLGIEGLIYINIINAASEDGNKIDESVFYKRFAASHAPRLNQYLKYLNDKGIKY
jgi:hypothetical protein